MKPEISLEQLLRWRLARAEAEAPPPPSAAQLLELARPWWEIWPERFRGLVERLGRLEIAYGHAMAESRRSHTENLVPAIIVLTAAETETSVRVLYFAIRDGQLRLRFQLSAAHDCAEAVYDATFVCRTTSQPLFSSQATLSIENEYSLNAELSEDLVAKWNRLKVTDEMPFRLILRPVKSAG
jgi:hypothetical protein